MTSTARITGLAIVFAIAATAPGCSNPKCWTHDSDEVPGGCSLGGGGGGGGGGGRSHDPEDYAAHDRQVIAMYDDECAAGDPVACWMLGDAQASLGQPPAVVEASYAAACRADLRLIPSQSYGPCKLAGAQAEQRGGSGTAAAIGYYQRGCGLGDATACELAILADPAPSPDVVLAACRRGSSRGCELFVASAAKAAAGAPADPAVVLEATRRGCAGGARDLCIRLGQREVAGR